MPAPVEFLRAARDQARDLQRRFVAHLMLHRHTQTRVAVVLASLITFGVFVLARASSPGDSGAAGASCSPTTVAHADVPADWRVVALPRDVIAPRTKPGDRIDVVAQAQVIAADAVVVAPATGDEGIVVAVPLASAAAVATSAQNGDVSVVGHG